MEIFFDGNYVYEDNYMSYEDNFSSFDKQFYLGSVASFEAKLQVPIKLITSTEGVYENYSTPSIVSISITDIGREATFVVDKEEFNDDNTVTLTLVDKLALTSTPLDISSLITYRKEWNAETQEWDETGTGVTAKDLLAYICNYYGINYTYTAFTNENVMTYSYDNTLTGRDYLSMIAELAGGYITLDRYGYLEITNYNLIPKNIFGINDKSSSTSSGLTSSVQNNTISLNGTYNNSVMSTILLQPTTSKVLEATKRYLISIVDFEGDIENEGVANLSIAGKTLSLINSQSVIFIPSSDITIGATLGQIILEIFGLQMKFENVNFKLSIVELDENPRIINSDNVDEYKINEEITIERVVYDNGISTPKESSSDDTLTTLYLEPNNFFLQTMTDATFNNICNKIIGLRYCNIDISTTNEFILHWNERYGQIILFKNIRGQYIPIFNNFQRSYMGDFVGSYKTSFESKRQTETEVIPAEDKINSIKTIINQQEGSLEILAGNTAKLRVDVDKIEGYFELTPGHNLIHNSAFLLTDEVWEIINYQGGSHTELGSGYNGSLVGITQSLGEIVLYKSKATTKENNITDLIIGQEYILSFYLTNDDDLDVSLKSGNISLIDETITDTDNMKLYSYVFTAIQPNATLIFDSVLGTSIIYDLLLLPGDKVKDWETAQGELYSTTLTMSRQGLKVFSTGSETLTLMTSDGFIIKQAYMQQGQLIIGETISIFDKNGIQTKDFASINHKLNDKVMSTVVNIDGTDHFIEYWL